MEIQALKENKEEDSAIIGVYDVKLKIEDGIRFGFGFGLGIILWGIIFSIIVFLGARIIFMMFAGSLAIF